MSEIDVNIRCMLVGPACSRKDWNMLVLNARRDFGSSAGDRFLRWHASSCPRQAVDDDSFPQGAVAEDDVEVELATAGSDRTA
ncbi:MULTISPECIES: hypothetical protein [unclassified Bradyrhizobium]|uniref:hypothetical protein n=1 Tax=unclassified Bradyrhizobium TaxID=2631580 RepID=UPI0020B434A4|nr:MULTISPECIES: hypothetical protein [unclassified Bradyrhizobium]MCP3380487.1 hypothetical protein [Bradyrhizobium sp. CCGUVB4N]MCP3441354.1 hypothetical protein [Bradyrhizobium sp. CCGUVB14]